MVGLIVAVEVYGALCLLTMALAYGLNDRGVAFERAWGSQRSMRVLRLLLLPYRVLARITLALLRRFDSDGVAPPGRPAALRGAAAVGLGAGKVDGGRGDGGLEPLCGIPSKVISAGDRDFADGLSADSRRHGPVGSAVPRGRRLDCGPLWRRGSVLVHRAQGRGRSVTVAAAALCRLGLAAGPDEALARIAFGPNQGQSVAQAAAGARSILELGSSGHVPTSSSSFRT